MPIVVSTHLRDGRRLASELDSIILNSPLVPNGTALILVRYRR